MDIVLSETAEKKSSIRVDLAFELFYPDGINTENGTRGMEHYPFANWLWDSFSRVSGNLVKNSQQELKVRISHLEKPILGMIVRIASMWADHVYIEEGGKRSEDLWTFPVSSTTSDEELDETERMFSPQEGERSIQRFLMPMLGPTRVFATVENLIENDVSARQHSHSSLDEYYIVLDGEATLRMNNRTRHLRKGDFVSKPAGPDLTSQIIADRGQGVRILDIEVWPDSSRMSKDLVYYPDQRELFLRGRGWSSIIPSDSMIDASDFMRNYEAGYARRIDGSWESSEVPGYEARKK